MPASADLPRRRQPWSTYAVQQTTLTAWALPYDLTLFYAWYRACIGEAYQYNTAVAGAVALAAWIVLTKSTKLMPHFVRHPEDTILLLPVVVVFGYVHGLIKFWGLVTLDTVSFSAPAPRTYPAFVSLTCLSTDDLGQQTSRRHGRRHQNGTTQSASRLCAAGPRKVFA